MLSKEQITDRRECNRLRHKEGIDKNCMNCSCNVCIAWKDAIEHGKNIALEKENETLKLMLGVVLESHKKGYSVLTEPIVKRIEELLK